MGECRVCSFGNPKATVTAVVIRDGKILSLKRGQEPFKDCWDLPGGFVQKNESIEGALRREIQEELRTKISRLAKIGEFNGSYIFEGKTYPVLSFAFYVELDGEIKLDKENYHWEFVPLDIDIAFDSNKDILKQVRIECDDIHKVARLVAQLDPSARVSEFTYLAAQHDGFVYKEYDGDNLVGLGSIFPRQTMLRKQAVVEDMIVSASQRGKGLGRKILNELVLWAKSNGVEVIELTSHPSRVAANELYKKYGFKLHPTNHYLYREENDSTL